jgi:predicted ArsR family transcriptional regulator
MNTQDNSGTQIEQIVRLHENQAFTISQLSATLKISRISVRKHCKKLGHETRHEPEKESKDSKFRFGRGDTKLTGTGSVLWFGKGKFSEIFGGGEVKIIR